MNFLADECCDALLVDGLRGDGHDVVYVKETAAGSDDLAVLQMAAIQQRVLLTEDKDFGQLVYAYGQKIHAVVFIRYPATIRKHLARDIVRLAKSHARKLIGCFVVIEPGRVRFSKP